MIKLSNIKMSPGFKTKDIISKAAAMLKIPESDILEVMLLKQSVDSRKKNDVHYNISAAFSVKKENNVLKKSKCASIYEHSLYSFPKSNITPSKKPIIVGAGPAGLFAAFCLVSSGIPCILIERGRPVEQRTEDINKFWTEGKLDCTSNVQFGEGGAGTFSDGKLTTGVNNPRIPFVFQTFVDNGAPENILYLNKPHIGTDKLRSVVSSMRRKIIELGGTVLFETKLENIIHDGNTLQQVAVSSNGKNTIIETDALILAIGNSARDTFRMLHSTGIKMEPKSFAVGVRIEHLQSDINKSQYGEAATLGTLPASDYKLAVHLENGRGVFTFCVCPGGTVVAAASEEGHVVTNGMSEFARDGQNINGGLLVSVDPSDFGGKLFGGMEFQEKLERQAFISGGSTYKAPAQLVSDFIAHNKSVALGKVTPTYLPGVVLCNLWDVLPEFICQALAEALPQMERKIHGFSSGDAVLTAVETRSSSPVRISRDEAKMANIKGIFPCGEGAGFAGGITSAAVDGIKSAEAVLEYLKQLS